MKNCLSRGRMEEKCRTMAGSNVVCGGKSKFAAHFFISPNRDQMLRENPIELCIGMC